MHSSVEFQIIDNAEELIRFAPEWRRLWAEDQNATPFQSPQWLLPWWRQFGSEELSSVVISRDRKPIGFLPFYLFRDTTRHERQLLPLGVGTTDYLDGVFAPECSPRDIADAVAFLRDRTHHHRICVPQLAAESRLLAALKDGDGAHLFLSQSDPCSRMPAVLISNLPQKIRRNAMYYRNRAQRSGTLELRLADGSNWQEIFSDLCRLHTSRWQHQGEQGVLADERVIAWHHETIPLLVQAGLLRLAVLRLEDETIAVLYSLIDPQRDHRAQYFYITAYSPDHADLRPGTLLIAYAVEHAAREGVATIDMLRGDEGYKQIWHMEKVPTWCFTAFAAQEAHSHAIESAA